ncbi:allantoinase PuuE [Celerinatantimonas sp. MCCC 1A17872]|uniref:allantoinase PuuE n=1 Tax=Celerinatantimonas sp. MCCC 1A17872 TaxID=3177514 RepID=UPI0038C88777
MQVTFANERNYVGYGANPEIVQWPNQARVALQFVLNYEEGGENSVQHGDEHAETFLSEIYGAEPYAARHISMESLYDYGSRVGVWRLLKEFEERQLPLTVFAIATALAKNPQVTNALISHGHEVCGHGLKWIHYQNVPKAIEQEHLHQALALYQQLTGSRPLGWYTGRDSPNTRQLLLEEGGFCYDSDSYADDLPFWMPYQQDGQHRAHLVVPYTLDNNDMRFYSPYGFSHGDEFFHYLKDSFDCLYAEGAEHPKMMSVGLHCRISGRPGRMSGLQRFLDYVQSKSDVWIAQRIDIARYWAEHYPYQYSN